MESLGIGLLVVAAIELFFSLIFLGFYVVRINKLDGLASNSLQKDRSLKFRIGCLLLMVLLAVVYIVLSFSDDNYYMYPYRQYSLVEIIVIINFLLQLYIITREHKKKTNRSRSVIFYWILMATQETCTIIIVEYYAQSVSIILTIFRVIISVLLIVLTFLLEPPQQTSLDNVKASMRESNLLPLMDDSFSKSTKNNERIYIQFNKQFQITLQKDHYEFSFKIAVYLWKKFHIITKSETEITQLSRDMIELFPHSDILSLNNVIKNDNAVNITKYGEQKRKIFQAFLVDLTKNDDYYAEPLMNFLQVHSTERQALQKYKGTLLKKDTMTSEDEENLKRAFFSVSWRNQKIHVSNSQILDFFVNKSLKQIISFHHKLINEKRLKIQLLTEQSDESEIAHFIYRVVNSKNLWRVFAQWMSLGKAIEDKIFSMFDFWNSDLSNFDMNVIGFETSFDKDKSLTYYYLLSINKKNNLTQDNVMLKKRYNDFVKLDKSLRKFIVSENVRNAHIPSLPPKFSPFESKTSPQFRRVYFDAYIKDIIKIEGINHCVKLLQFFEVNSDEVSEDSYKPQEVYQEEKEIKISSMNLDDLSFDNVS